MLDILNTYFPVRYTVMVLSALGLLLSLVSFVLTGERWLEMLLFASLVGVGVYDLVQTRRSILRNYPIIGHIRYMLEYVRP